MQDKGVVLRKRNNNNNGLLSASDNTALEIGSPAGTGSRSSHDYDRERRGDLDRETLSLSPGVVNQLPWSSSPC